MGNKQQFKCHVQHFNFMHKTCKSTKFEHVTTTLLSGVPEI